MKHISHRKVISASITYLLIYLITSFSLFTTAYADPLTGTPATYTLDEHFDQGTMINVVHDPSDQLQLDDTTKAFNFIWVAASARGTIIKIDTTNGDILGEYHSAPAGRGKNPSRTTVDANGNVWSGNRDESAGGLGSVVHIGLEENGQCVDRNNNGVIDTSTGLGDIRDWNNAGGADDNGGVSTAEDECIIHYVRTSGTNVRTVAIDANNDVWIGGLGNRVHELYDGDTGLPITGTQFNLGCGGYGGLVDGNGVLWSSSSPGAGGLLRYDPSISAGRCLNFGLPTYGLGIDTNGNIWLSNWDLNSVQKISPAGTLVNTFPSEGASNDRGVAVTPADNNVWVANSGGTDVSRLDNNGNLMAVISVGVTPTGVAVDGNGNVWVTNLGSDNAMRINPATNVVDLTVELGTGAGPYNYSDMTGSTVIAPPSAGTWSVIHDTEIDDVKWGTVSWTSEEPGDSSIVVTVASSNDGINFSAPETATNGGDLAIPDGRWVEVIVSFNRSTNSDADNDGIYDSPILFDLTIAAITGKMKGKGVMYLDHGDCHRGRDRDCHDYQVTHQFSLYCDPSQEPNDLVVLWGEHHDDHHDRRGRDNRRDHHERGYEFKMKELVSADCSDDPAIDPGFPLAYFDTHQGAGIGSLNGEEGYSVDWTFTDAGEPGDNDFADIVITDPDGVIVLSVSGTLDEGNHEAMDDEEEDDDDD